MVLIFQAFEMFDEECMQSVIRQMSNARQPFNQMYPFYVLIETSGSVNDHDRQVV